MNPAPHGRVVVVPVQGFGSKRRLRSGVHRLHGDGAEINPGILRSPKAPSCARGRTWCRCRCPALPHQPSISNIHRPTMPPRLLPQGFEQGQHVWEAKPTNETGVDRGPLEVGFKTRWQSIGSDHGVHRRQFCWPVVKKQYVTWRRENAVIMGKRMSNWSPWRG